MQGDLVGLIKRFRVEYDCDPERIELHPDDAQALLVEVEATATCWPEEENKLLETPAFRADGFFCYFLGVATYRRDDVTKGKPRLVLL